MNVRMIKHLMDANVRPIFQVVHKFRDADMIENYWLIHGIKAITLFAYEKREHSKNSLYSVDSVPTTMNSIQLVSNAIVLKLLLLFNLSLSNQHVVQHAHMAVKLMTKYTFL